MGFLDASKRRSSLWYTSSVQVEEPLLMSPSWAIKASFSRSSSAKSRAVCFSCRAL